MAGKEKQIERSAEIEDAREFAELCGQLSPYERQQVKNIIIGIRIAKGHESEAVAAV